MVMQDEWKKVEMSPTWDFESKKELIGVYISKEENVGRNQSNLYNFKVSDGSIVSVWGSALLDSRFKNIPVGAEVKVAYLGKEKSERTGRQFNNFEIYFKAKQSQVPNEDVDPDEVKVGKEINDPQPY